MQGWIKLHLQLVNKAIWKTSTPSQKVILITLLMMADFKENEWEWDGDRYKTKPGQFVTSLQSITNNCGKGISIQNVRTALKRFEKYGFLTSESTNKNRLITIVNWEFYQDFANETNKEDNKQLTSNQQATNKQLTTNKECNKVNNGNNNNISSKKKNDYSQEFEDWYKDYPRKGNKRNTYNHFLKVKKSEGVDTILTATEHYKDYIKQNSIEPTYIYASHNFLGQKAYYEDFLEPPEKTNKLNKEVEEFEKMLKNLPPVPSYLD